MKTRTRYFDTIKLLAIFVVFITHFVASFNEDYFCYWKEPPTSYLLWGVSGKFGVVIFSVILGYFAYRSSEKSIAKYTIKRYVYFVICGLFINSVYLICARTGYIDANISIRHLIKTSLLLGSDIYPTFWCIQPFMLASFISKVNGRFLADKRWGIIVIAAEIAALIKTGHLWAGICLMGNLVYILENDKYVLRLISHRIVRIAVYLIFFFAIKRSSSDLTYIIDGAVCSMVLIALKNSTMLTGLLNNEAMASAGRNTMAIYLIHNILYEAIGGAMISEAHFAPTFLAALVVSWAVIVLVSYPVTKLLDSVNRFCGKYIDKAFSLISPPEEAIETQ